MESIQNLIPRMGKLGVTTWEEAVEFGRLKQSLRNLSAFPKGGVSYKDAAALGDFVEKDNVYGFCVSQKGKNWLMSCS